MAKKRNVENKFIESYSMENVILNSKGVNAKIQYHILSEEKMRELGFYKNYHEGTVHEEYSPYWYLARKIPFPKEKRWKYMDIEFIIRLPKDGTDLDISVLDMDFCQPYDYQRFLMKNPYNECANIVNDQVEDIMEYLQHNGVISGHAKGEYI